MAYSSDAINIFIGTDLANVAHTTTLEEFVQRWEMEKQNNTDKKIVQSLSRVRPEEFYKEANREE